MSDMLTNVWDSSGWFSLILDFTIVFYLIYVTLLLIRGTRTVPMALGLLVVVILYLVSQSLKLATTYMLLDQFMEVAVIFALIIFQDDIRRALVRMGRFAWFLKAKESQVVEEVVRAASNLAGKRLGAIIVFERDASLDEFMEKGTILDAAVTKELLYTIFIPRMENPLHDGAVIIKNLRIREAGALLPLSGNPKLGKNLGTRHRAALGITEETDAVAIVVSEERGTMSLCFDGRMSKNLDGDSMRKALYGLFSEEKNRERRRAAEERKSVSRPKRSRSDSLVPSRADDSKQIVTEKGESSRKVKTAARPEQSTVTPVPKPVTRDKTPSVVPKEAAGRGDK